MREYSVIFLQSVIIESTLSFAIISMLVVQSVLIPGPCCPLA